jgi:hypothetical protein
MQRVCVIFVFGVLALLGGQAWAAGPATAPPGPAGQTAVASCPLGWQLVSHPNPGAAANYLWGVAADPAGVVWTVGSIDPGNGVLQTLVERWDGQSWQVVPSPSTASGNNVLYSVAAAGPNDVWAVGVAADRPLIEHWDGSQWQIRPFFARSDIGGELSAVTAVRPDDVWAVGWQGPFSERTQLILHWDGAVWRAASGPNRDLPRRSYLTAVAATSRTDVWAVGGAGGGTLVEHWNGTAWAVVPSANRRPASRLYAVAPVSAANVWAVGSDLDALEPEHPMVEQWNGAQWSLVPASLSGNTLLALTVIGAADIWAVGDGNGQPLIEHWDGSTWSLTPGPSVPDGVLTALAQVSPTDLWAVGTNRLNRQWDSTLIAHYAPICPSAGTH